MDPNVLNGDGVFNSAPSGSVTKRWRPGARELSSVDFTTDISQLLASGTTSSTFSLLQHTHRVQNAARTYQNIDPIVINLDGGGVNFIELEKSFVLFDVDNDGYLENTAWIKRGSAFLVIDKNGNGKLDDVTELAGEHYFDDPRLNTSALVPLTHKKFSMRKYQKHAFQVLQLYDFNGDKVLNSTDGIFSELLLWHDKNEDGTCEDAEMHSLAEYKITSIDLKYQPNKDTRQSQIQYISQSFTTNGHAMATYAIAFKANKEGDMLSNVPLGHILRSETGLASLKLNKAATVFVTNHSIQNIHGSDEDDELYGDEKENWFIGGKGKDKMSLGDGNDICVIDAEDDPSDIDGGAGFNIAYATGDTGIVFVMYQSRINQTYGTEFADFIAVGNQNETTSGGFIESGAGDDLVIGDDASDALSGGDDDDHVKGMGGNDLVRGDRGEDLLELGTGDDIGEGGDGNDIIFGEEGDDSLKGDRGNDKLHGGPGTDFAEYVGSFDEYRIEKVSDGHYIIQDLHPNRDGRDELFDIEKLVFSSNGGSYTVTLDKLFQGYQDFIPLNEVGPTIINPAQLLLNDINFSGEEIYICEVHDPQNGQITTTKVGDKITQIQFTSTVAYQTIKQFGYTLCTSDAKDSVVEIDTNRSATHYIKVYLNESSHPKDELFYSQWYLAYTNIVPVWQFYSGKNVTILVNEGSADHTHIDLRNNLKFHEPHSDRFDVHATTVAGIIAASRNNIGIVGIAYNAILGSEEGVSVAHTKYDVIDRSWGWASAQPFVANFSEAQELHITKIGRHGLGTVIVQSAGNERNHKDNTNDFQQTNSLYSIVVGAIYKDASLSYVESNVEAFSNRGASVLISAPGSHITTSSALTENNNGNVFTWDYDMVKGTSFSAPIVAGIIALMLEANPCLGYRDVEKILAITARKVNDPITDWAKNADISWNSEGHHYSHDYGFGCVNAYQAVKFAEFWPYLSSHHNIEQTSANSTFGIKAIVPQTTFSWPLEVSANFIVQNVVLEYEISHKNFSSVLINLISPHGTKSYLKEENSRNITSTRIRFRALSKHFMGENSQGIWTYEIVNKHQMQLGFLNSANLTIFGDLYTSSIAIITSEISASHAIESPMVLAPSLQENLEVDLKIGNSFFYSGLSFQFKSMPSNFVSGTGHDVITGNQLDNVIYTNDGNDKSYGNGGNDLLIGGRGSNWYSGGAGTDVFVIHFDPNNVDTISDFALEDFAIFVGFPNKIDVRYEAIMNSDNALFLNRFNYHAFFKINESTHYHQKTTNINQLIIGSKTKDILHGSSAHDLIIGNGGDDILLGWSADDILICANGNCLAYGHEGNDELRSGRGVNRLLGGPGNDIFVPGIGAVDLLLDFNQLEDKIKGIKPKITHGSCLAEYKLLVPDCTYLKSETWQIVLPGTNLNLENVFIN